MHISYHPSNLIKTSSGISSKMATKTSLLSNATSHYVVQLDNKESVIVSSERVAFPFSFPSSACSVLWYDGRLHTGSILGRTVNGGTPSPHQQEGGSKEYSVDETPLAKRLSSTPYCKGKRVSFSIQESSRVRLLQDSVVSLMHACVVYTVYVLLLYCIHLWCCLSSLYIISGAHDRKSV